MCYVANCLNNICYLCTILGKLCIYETNLEYNNMIQQIAKDNEAVTPITREMEGLKEYFPQCFNAQGEFDIEKFREAIQPQVDVTREGRSYDFLGKSYARMLSSLDTTTVIRPDVEHNSKPENANSENIYISGDNLDALHHLVKSYAGQVKCIYIDPPYNTGTDGFVYNDKFKFTAEDLEKKLSISPDEAEKIIAMTSGHRASHAAWLTFMMPRLQLARDLLSKDGVIFISIDDNEQSYLKQLCDFIFGEDNCLGMIANINNPKGRSDDKYIATAHEYLLVYAENVEKVFWLGFEPVEDQIIKRYNKTDKNGKKYREIDLRKTGENDLREDRPNLFYYFHYNQETGDFYPSRESEGKEGYVVIRPLREDGKEGNWRWGIDTAKAQISQLTPKFMPTRKVWGVMQMDYLEGRPLIKPTSAWTFKDVNSERGTEDFISLGFDKRIFPKPKPVGTIMRCISLTSKNDNDIILDFFSGSATTAQSVFQVNTEDGVNRKFILVQLQEETRDNSEAQKAGYHAIDQIGMERIKRAAKKIKEENPDFAGDLGFKHYTLEEVPQNTLDKLETYDPNVLLSTDDTLNMFGRDTVLTTWLVNDGYGLGAKTEDIVLDKYHATLCGNHLYMTDADFTEEDMAALVDRYQSDPKFNPDCIVLFGYSFGHNAKDMLEKNKPTINLVKDKNIIIDVRY